MKQRLLDGQALLFSNEEFQMKNNQPDITEAALWFEDDPTMPNWARGFQLWIGMEQVHSCKTWVSMEKRLRLLMEEYNLKLVINEPA